MRATASWTQ